MTGNDDNQPQRPRWFNWSVTLLFVAALAAPTVDHLARNDEARGPGPELRSAARRPWQPRRLAQALAFPAAYEAYWRDSFGLRDLLLRWHSVLKVLVFGVTPDANHVIGRERWIFNQDSQLVDNWRGVIPLHDEELLAWQRRIERRRDAVAAVGAHYLFAIAPDKPQIYPEYLPARFNKVGPSRMDQLYAHLAAQSDADCIDLRPALRAERARDVPGDYVYYPLGTHWEKRGAIAGYNAIAEHLHPLLPGLRRYKTADFTIGLVPGGDSEARNMYIGDLLPQVEHRFALKQRRERIVAESKDSISLEDRITFEVADAGLPRVLMFHDSFGQTFRDEWANTCSRLVMVHSYDFDQALVEAEAPDLVLEFIVERTLVFQAPQPCTEHETPSRREQFDGAGPALAVVDASRPALRGIGRATARVESDDEGGAIALEVTGGIDSFAFDPPVDVCGRRLVVRASFEATARSRASLYWMHADETGLMPERRTSVVIAPGRSTVYFAVPASDAQLTGLVLQPESAGTCKLRALEVRALPPGS